LALALVIGWRLARLLRSEGACAQRRKNVVNLSRYVQFFLKFSEKSIDNKKYGVKYNQRGFYE
jgi:hypothetical protein